MRSLLLLLTSLAIATGISLHDSDIQQRNEPGRIASPDTLKKDLETGLIVDKDLYMVKAQCTSCHSSKLIIANHFTRDGWKQKIRWMQANHNLWDLGETEKQVLDYLEKYYAPTQTYARRQPLRDIKWYKLDVK